MSTPNEHGRYAIKVDGEEIDHADTRAEAKRARNAIIYGGIGTEANTTIEPKPIPGKCSNCGDGAVPGCAIEVNGKCEACNAVGDDWRATQQVRPNPESRSSHDE